MSGNIRLRVMLACASLLFLAASTAAVAQQPAFFTLPKAKVGIDGKPLPEGQVFADAGKTQFLVCIQSDFVYKVDRKAKQVVALRRSAVMVKQDRCRPMEGAKEQPITGHLYEETKGGFSFNELGGRKVSVEFPPGTLR